MSNFLTGIGLGGLDLGVVCLILFILMIVLVVLMFLQMSRMNRLEERIDRLSEGTDGESLEDALLRIFDEYEGLHKVLSANRRDVDEILDRMHGVIQKVGIVKYNAFKQVGGNLSSAICLLNQDDDGFILNTVQNLDGCYSYCKQVKNGISKIELTSQEREALQEALDYGNR